MEENFQQKQQLRQPSSGLRSRTRGGEIVEVQGGHIIRSTGLKDRHSKVCTAKGARDRRVRLSATTAIQFYDVQDRLGYDRPSKAVDWLIMKSKAAIDELEEMPPWHPTSCLSSGNSNFPQEQAQNLHHQQQQQISLHHGSDDAEPASKRVMTMVGLGNEIKANPSGSSTSFLPPSLDSDSIADTIKSFFPMGQGNSSNLQLHNQSFQPSDMFPRTNEQSQDLSLSLQSFQDPIFLHQNDEQTQLQSSTSHTEQVEDHIQAQPIFSRANHLGSFDVSGWSEQAAEIGRLQRLNTWNPYGDTSNTAGYLFTSQPIQQQQPLLQQFLAQSQLLSQRGSLQSSNSPSFRNWVDPSSVVIPAADNHHHQQPYQTVFPINPSSFSGIGYSSGFSGFHIPAQIHGEEVEHDGLSDKPSSASSDSRY